MSWKRGATILIYKKGDTSNPENFRPITLQPACHKIFSSILSHRLNSFLSDNNYTLNKIQKGFQQGVDGVSEHSEQLHYMLKVAKKEQRVICIALLDLKNAFGLIDHLLIKHSLQMHYAPDKFLKLFDNIYKDSKISIAV